MAMEKGIVMKACEWCESEGPHERNCPELEPMFQDDEYEIIKEETHQEEKDGNSRWK